MFVSSRDLRNGISRLAHELRLAVLVSGQMNLEELTGLIKRSVKRSNLLKPLEGATFRARARRRERVFNVDQPGLPGRSRRCNSSFTAGVGADLNATSL